MLLNSFLANTTLMWSQSDTLERYTPVFADESSNKYNVNDIEYRYNDFGYRCDNFNDCSDIPIVYLGCSFTEGVGLPIESTWGYLLNERIRAATNKKIPFWSLAQGGRGLDNQVKLLYEFTRLYPIKYVFCLFPPAGRREYTFRSSRLCAWMPKTDAEHIPEINRLFSDHHYMMHEDRKYAMMLDLIRSEQKAQVFTTTWVRKFPEWVPNRGSLVDYRYAGPIDPRFSEFKHITSFGHTNNGAELGNDRARDGIHPGKLYQLNIANQYWEKVKHLFQIGEQEGN
jgi:hypothetical protein